MSNPEEATLQSNNEGSHAGQDPEIASATADATVAAIKDQTVRENSVDNFQKDMAEWPLESTLGTVSTSGLKKKKKKLLKKKKKKSVPVTGDFEMENEIR